MKRATLLLIAMLVASVSTTLSAQKKVDPTGTWSYEATQAPYGYTTGDIVVAEESKDFTVEMVLGEYRTKAEKVTYEKNELSFAVYVDGERVDIKMTVQKESMEGNASYSEGAIPITAKRKK
jgi:hypothetical protein